ncbi:hypothetical protein ACFL5F_01165 [Planctomycetota bacterium]
MSKKKKASKKRAKTHGSQSASRPKYPRHSLEKALRIPLAILEQNAGKECTDKDAAGFVGLTTAKGPFTVEISSSIKYGLLERPTSGKIAITDLGKKILRPQASKDELEGLREAVLKAPDVSDVYNHYRGENLPDDNFFDNAIVDKFKIPQEKIKEFKTIFLETIGKAKLIEEHQGKRRLIDFSKGGEPGIDSAARLKKIGKDVTISAGDSCFVMMPFEKPYGDYYSLLYESAIKKAGLKPIRADHEIFGAGKIMDQVWSGIKAAKVLVAELTTKNPNVFYELGLAHALKKPVVLVSSNEQDVPFDLHHIRVIYYDVNDPFWGQKLLEKVAENILSALKNPEEAIFEGKIEKDTKK